VAFLDFLRPALVHDFRSLDVGIQEPFDALPLLRQKRTGQPRSAPDASLEVAPPEVLDLEAGHPGEEGNHHGEKDSKRHAMAPGLSRKARC
jgi:hypothetical protein